LLENQQTLVIREATLADAEYISLLGRITFAETFGHIFRDPQDLQDYHQRTFSVSKIRNSLLADNNVFWLAFYDELPVGYAKLKIVSPCPYTEDSQSDEQVSQLQKIYILKDFLAMKIGIKLQDALLGKAKALGSSSIWLSVLDSNDRAISFYKKSGFNQVGTHDFQIGKEHFDFTAMQKYLT